MLVIGSRASSAAVLNRQEGPGIRDWDMIMYPYEYEAFIETHKHLIIDHKTKLDRFHRILIGDYKNREVLEIEVSLKYQTSYELLDKSYLYSAQQTAPKNVALHKFATDYRCPPTQRLAMIKRAHLQFEHNFYKHIKDYHQLRNWELPWDTEWTARRAKEQVAIHEQLKKISLKKDTNTFFDQSADKIKPLFIHDEIHKQIAGVLPPAYTLFQSEEVFCDKQLWDKLTQSEKIRAVREEAMTLAIERILVPFHLQGNWFNLPASRVNPRMAFEWGLMRVCTTITSGWFRSFAIENWPTIHQSNTNWSPEATWTSFKIDAALDKIPLYKGGIYARPEKLELGRKISY